MTKTQQLEQTQATIAECRNLGMHDTANELARTLPALERESAEERTRLRAAVGGPLAGLVDAVGAAPAAAPAWVPEAMSEERLRRRAALNPLLAAFDLAAQKGGRK